MGRVYNYTGMLPFALSGQILHNIIHYFCPIKKNHQKRIQKKQQKNYFYSADFIHYSL